MFLREKKLVVFDFEKKKKSRRVKKDKKNPIHSTSNGILEFLSSFKKFKNPKHTYRNKREDGCF